MPDSETNLSRANQPFGFTGYQTDEISGLYYAQARYYEPNLGRFTAEDLIKGYVALPKSLNQYTYCWNQSLTLVDLDGLEPVYPEVCAIAMGARGGVSIVQDGYNIRIYADFYFATGDGAEGVNLIAGQVQTRSPEANRTITIAGVDTTIGITYANAFLQGVEQNLGGTFGNYQVTVVATSVASPNDGIRVEIRESLGVSHVILPPSGWSNSNRGTIVMYQGDCRGGIYYELPAFRWVSAHEFVHTLGLDDALGTNIPSIMRDFWEHLEPWDIEMILRAWNDDEWQQFPGCILELFEMLDASINAPAFSWQVQNCG